MSTNTTVAESVAGNVDVLLEILLRLPAKSLVRFKLVSKQWCSHISDPQFVNAHVRRNPNKSPTGIFLCALDTRSDGTKFVPFNALDSSYQTIPSLIFLNSIDEFVHDIKIIQSCNGLLLCEVTVGEPVLTDHYCVFNPTTKLFKLLPELESPSSTYWSLGKFLAFEPSDSLCYKVMVFRLLSTPEGKCTSEIWVYSSENQCWRVSTSPFNPMTKGGVFMNGAIYWPGEDRNAIICFDVITEEVKRIPLSFHRHVFGSLPSFCKGTGGSRLFCIERFDRAVEDFRVLIAEGFRVLEMCLDEFSKTAKWVTKYESSVSVMQSLFPPDKPPYFGFVRFSPLCVVEGVQVEELAVVLEIPGQIIWYDIMHETVNPLCEISEPFSSGDVQAFQYIESLYAV